MVTTIFISYVPSSPTFGLKYHLYPPSTKETNDFAAFGSHVMSNFIPFIGGSNTGFFPEISSPTLQR